MADGVANPGNTTPAVVQRVNVDIDLSGGVDESTSEIAVDWTKRVLRQENLVFDGQRLSVRPGTKQLTNQPSSPVFRVTALDEGAGVIAGPEFALWQQAEKNNGQLVEKDMMPEWSHSVRKASATVGISSLVANSAGAVLGTAKTDRYDVILYEATTKSNSGGGIADPSAGISGRELFCVVELIDRNSNQTVYSYFWNDHNNGLLNMVGVDGRYLHFLFPGGNTAAEGSVGPSIFVIDTQSPPASPDLNTLSRRNLGVTGTGTTWEIAAFTPIVGGSIAIVQHTAHDRNVWMEQFNNTTSAPTSIRSVAVTGFQYVTGMDVDDSGNTYLSGYNNVPTDISTMNFQIWQRGPWSGVALGTWSGTASAGASGTQSLTGFASGQQPAAGTGLAGFASADFDGVNDQMSGPAENTIFSALAGNSFSIAILCKPDTAAADISGATTLHQNPNLFDSNASATPSVCITYSTAGFALVVRDTSVPNFKRQTAAAATGSWHMVKCTWDGASKLLRCWVDGSTIPAGVAVTTPLALAASASGFGSLGGTASTFFDGQILEFIVAKNQLFTDTEFNTIKLYFNDRYSAGIP
jgi:hypothetical protein